MEIIKAIKYLFFGINKKTEVKPTNPQEEQSISEGTDYCTPEIEKLISSNQKSIDDYGDFSKDTIPIKSLYLSSVHCTSEHIIRKSDVTEVLSVFLKKEINSEKLILGEVECKYKETTNNLNRYYWIYKIQKGYLVIKLNERQLYFIDNFSWKIIPIEELRYAITLDDTDDPIIRVCFRYSFSKNDMLPDKLFSITKYHKTDYNNHLHFHEKFEDYYALILKDYDASSTWTQILEDTKRARFMIR